MPAGILGQILAPLAGGIASHFFGGKSGTPGPEKTAVPSGLQSGMAEAATAGMKAAFGQSPTDAAREQGEAQGAAQKAYFDAFAPDTTQWERMGSQSPGMANITATKDTNKTALQVAKINQATQVKTAQIAASAPLRQAAVAERLAPSQEAQLRATISHLSASEQERVAQAAANYAAAQVSGQVAKIKMTEAALTEELIRSRITANEGQNIKTMIMSGVEDVKQAQGEGRTLTTGEMIGMALTAGAGALGFKRRKVKTKKGEREGWYYQDNKGNVDYHGN